MRAKKTILLVDAIESRLSLRSFLFYTRGFRVFKSRNAVDAVENLQKRTIDLVACNIPKVGVRAIAKEAGIINPEIPVWIVGNKFSSEQLVQHAKLLSARKRGPKRRVL